MKDVYKLIGVAMLLIVALFLLAGCSGDGSGGNSTSSFRLTAQAAGVVVPENNLAQATPQATPTPTLAPQVVYQPVEKLATVVVRETVEVTQPAQVIEVTRVIEIVTTPTTDIAGFQDSGIDESVQPCPIKFWKRNRCIASDATVEAYASEVQP